MRKIALLLTLSLFALTACNTSETTEINVDSNTETTETTEVPDVFASDLTAACNGIATAKAAAYTQDAGVHPVILFGRDSSTETYYEKIFTLAEGWQVSWEQAADYQLAACVTTTPTTMAESCEFDVDGDTYVLETYGADYKVGLYETQTGKEVATTTLSLPADECPSLYYFSEQTEQSYPDYEQPLTEFLKPYVQK